MTKINYNTVTYLSTPTQVCIYINFFYPGRNPMYTITGHVNLGEIIFSGTLGSSGNMDGAYGNGGLKANTGVICINDFFSFTLGGGKST